MMAGFKELMIFLYFGYNGCATLTNGMCLTLKKYIPAIKKYEASSYTNLVKQRGTLYCIGFSPFVHSYFSLIYVLFNTYTYFCKD